MLLLGAPEFLTVCFPLVLAIPITAANTFSGFPPSLVIEASFLGR
jgi:hypothetical protein